MELVGRLFSAVGLGVGINILSCLSFPKMVCLYTYGHRRTAHLQLSVFTSGGGFKLFDSVSTTEVSIKYSG